MSTADEAHGGTGRRYRLTLEYDGTDFLGFQYLGEGRRSVQGEVERAIERVTGRAVRVHGAGRTDAGVHALGQVVHFDLDDHLEPRRLQGNLNGVLPKDVSVRRCVQVEAGFHSRFDATGRSYLYCIVNRSPRSALRGRFAWHMPGTLDLGRMRDAARLLVGTHDYAAFGRAARVELSTVRQVRRIAVRRWRGMVLVSIEGNAFLRHMVRALVATLVQIGLGRMPVVEAGEILASKDPDRCPAIAPAKGLCLMAVEYTGQRVVLAETKGMRK
ncbi:MAG: tRNA pseudouridine(38-40) synthase TruA [Armatimonadota bacterium]